MLGRRKFLRLLGFGALLPLVPKETSAITIGKEDIHLIDVYVAGFQYYDGMREDVLRSLQVDDRAILKREPANKYDRGRTPSRCTR